MCKNEKRIFIQKAQELGCNKIALGHHFDDVIETVLMGMLFAGKMQTMMPKLKSTSHPGMELIRPFYFVREDDVISWMNYNDLEFIKCACKITERQAKKKSRRRKDLKKSRNKRINKDA